MKRIFSISSIFISTFILLILPTIPHHHHKGIACVVMEYCVQDNTVNDEHTHHANDNKQEQNCVAESYFTIPQLNEKVKVKTPFSGNKENNFIVSLLYFPPVGYWDNNLVESFQKNKYCESFIFYHSAELSRQYGLRAPPHTFL